MWDNDAATHTEGTQDLEERLGRLATRIAKIEGATLEELEFLIRVEQLMPDYRAAYGEYVAEDFDNRAGDSMKLWARERLRELVGSYTVV
eukprot:3680716-Karenia_brevis.AAC.1